MCCKADRDFRASEYATLMPSSHSVQVAVKYASKIRKMALAERLNGIGRRKLEQEEEPSDDDDFENVKNGTIIYTRAGNAGSSYAESQDLFATTTSNGRTEMVIQNTSVINIEGILILVLIIFLNLSN